jgi:hypothetical protein
MVFILIWFVGLWFGLTEWESLLPEDGNNRKGLPDFSGKQIVTTQLGGWALHGFIDSCDNCPPVSANYFENVKQSPKRRDNYGFARG